MVIERVLSLNNGWSILSSQKQKEWEEVLMALSTIDDESLLGWIREGGADATSIGYVYLGLNQQYNHELRVKFNWPAVSPGNELSQDKYRTIPIKNKTLATVAGTDDLLTFSFPKLLHITIPYHHQENLIDVGIILAPTSELVEHILELGAKEDILEPIPVEEFCRVEAARFIALASRAPIVLAFFSSASPDKIVVEEVSLPRVSAAAIERIIEFAPEHYQAGVGLLSYFGEVLRQKDPNTKAKVRIEQEGKVVRLHIESPSGDIETIEEELEKYALVISNKAAPESLFENRAYIMQLEHRLDVTKLELKQAYNTIALTEGINNQRINNLEQQVTFLKDQVAAQLQQNTKVIELVGRQSDSHERMQAALLTHGQLLFNDMREESRGNSQLLTAIQSLHQNLLSGLTTIDVEEQIKQALETVKQQKPGLLARIYSQVEGAALKAGAGASLGWAAELIKRSLPVHQ